MATAKKNAGQEAPAAVEHEQPAQRVEAKAPRNLTRERLEKHLEQQVAEAKATDPDKRAPHLAGVDKLDPKARAAEVVKD